MTNDSYKKLLRIKELNPSPDSNLDLDLLTSGSVRAMDYTAIRLWSW